MKYRKKPVVIEAWQWNGRTLADAIAFCADNGLPQWGVGSRKGMSGLIIPTLEGDHVAQAGDWIIRGIQGEYYPCKNDIFEATYEPVEESADCPLCQTGVVETEDGLCERCARRLEEDRLHEAAYASRKEVP